MSDRYELVYFEDSGELHTVDLSAFGKRRIAVGRNWDQVDVVISPKLVVSRLQGYFYLDETGVTYEDAHSTNGTVYEEGVRKGKLFQTTQRIALSESCFLRVQNQGESVLFFVRRVDAGNGWKKIAVGHKRLTIGRNPSNDIILSYPTVSKNHAFVEQENGGFFLTDRRSRNGSYVNGCLVNGKVRLKDFDIIQILDVQMIFIRGILYYCAKVQGVHLVAEDIYKVVNRKKVLLNHVNLEIKSNDFVAIIGGSGAGKTTLMNAISGFDQKCSGTVYFNGHELRKEFGQLKDLIGYVPQQEIIYENLTLHNMLRYTAKMKMSNDTDNAEVENRIAEVLEMVELTQHANTYIRKLSGGQKKRASIAVELLADPKLFFLDEPTSGLDPGTEKNLMMMLNRLSKTRDKTTILVTHTTQNLHLCDKVIFMGPGGYLCFYGTVEQAKMFFQTDDLVNIYNIIAQNPAMWAEQFQNCCEKPVGAGFEKKAEESIKQHGVSAARQCEVLTMRYAELIWNDRIRLLILLAQPVIIALLLNVVADDKIYHIYEPTQSMMFSLSCSAIWIGLFNSIQEICKERVIVKREYMASLKLPIYILSKYLVQYALAAVQAALLMGVFALLVGEFPEGIWFGNFFFEMYVTVLLTILASMSIGLLISALVKSGDKAMTLAPFVLIIQLLFSGILFKLEGIGKTVSYATISKWSVAALGSIVDLNNLELRMQSEVPYLTHEFEEIYEHTGANLVGNWLVLVGMTTLFLALSTAALTTIRNDAR